MDAPAPGPSAEDPTPVAPGHIGFTVREAVQAKGLDDAGLARLLEVLRGLEDPGSRFLVAAADRGDPAALRGAIALLVRVGRYSHVPGVLKGLPGVAAADELVTAALEVVDDPRTAAAHNSARPLAFPVLEMWALAALAVRTDPAVADRLAATLAGDHVPDRIQDLRRAGEVFARKAAAPVAAVPADPAGPPQKVSQVAAWLRQHPHADPELLAPRPRQKAAAKVAAVRALGTIATPAAFDVLTRYATDAPSSAMLEELHRAWPRFDRQAFAAALLLPRHGGLDLGVCADLDGIEAVPGLRRLKVVLVDQLDLGPLAGCSGLEQLTVLANGSPGLGDLGVLTRLPALRLLDLSGSTRHADLTVLAGLPLTGLRLTLDGADASVLRRIPSLQRVCLAALDDSGDLHPGTPDVVRALVAAGVEVVLYLHERSWVGEVAQQAAADPDVHAVSTNGYLGLTRDPDAVERLQRRLYLGSLL
ncbi:hypothetical protein [Auraticoccus monumenti]|uniref:Leucine Rich repeat-containing protein n=1 Tax=Auraticoccus monumenti TaxID=675864 RepID=A0A1G6UAG0_9ACTN|nr:hypothetical protein [Auraticoccus monumenti]SDD38271.1 hypothetical protein SAMN04489747_0834 [Auraticoccus monumenti]